MRVEAKEAEVQGRGKRGGVCVRRGVAFSSPRRLGFRVQSLGFRVWGARAWVAPAPVVADWRPAEISRCSIAGAGRGFSVRVRLQVLIRWVVAILQRV